MSSEPDRRHGAHRRLDSLAPSTDASGFRGRSAPCGLDGRADRQLRRRRPSLGSDEPASDARQRPDTSARRDHRQRQHQRQADGRDDVADVGGAAAKRRERDRGQGADQRSLPHELQQRPPDGLCGGLAAAAAQSRCHLRPPPARAGAVDGLADFPAVPRPRRASGASACITSFVAEPPNARSTQVAHELPLRLFLAEARAVICVRSRSSRSTSPFSVMICSSFSAVV